MSLARKLGVKTGDWVKVSSARGEVVVKAMVTRDEASRRRQEVTIVWMPYNWGFQGLSTGPSVNHLTIDAVDPGAGTQETKACLVNIVRSQSKRRRHPVSEARHHDRDTDRPGQVDVDRHHQLHRLPRLPSRLQALERARRRANRGHGRTGLSEPRVLSANTLTLITYHELRTDGAGGLRNPLHHAALPALHRAGVRGGVPDHGAQTAAGRAHRLDATKCIGCRYCVWACPWGVPTADWDSLSPRSTSAPTVPTAATSRRRCRAMDSC